MDAVLLLIVSLQMEDIKLPMRRGRMEDIGDEEVCTNAKFLRNDKLIANQHIFYTVSTYLYRKPLSKPSK